MTVLACESMRHAWRSLRRSPGFTLIAVLTLALGTGSATALFSVLDGVVLKPLAYPQPERIVSLVNQYKNQTGQNLTGGDEIDLAAEHGIFEAVAYYHGGAMGVQLSGRAEFVGVRQVHPDFFRVFGVPPAAGRTLNVDDQDRAAVVSAGFAARNFGSAPAALGQKVSVEDHTYDIVGVMPALMQFPPSTDVWAAATVNPSNRNRTGHNYRAVARLADGVSIDAANARLAILGQRLAQEFPDSNAGKSFASIALRDNLVSQVKTTLYVLMGAVALVLLIACANVANLMLARGAARLREVAVRAALGASRRRIIEGLLLESLLIALMACAAGLLIAYGGTALLLRVGARYVPLPRLEDVQIDWRVLAFSAFVTLVTTIACGLIPALQATRVSVRDALSQGGTRGTVGGSSRGMRAGLVVAQIALSCTLAIDAGLLFRSFTRLTETPLGFDTSSVLVMYAHAPARGSIFNGSGLQNYIRVGRLFDDVLGRLRQRPEIVAAGGVMGLPTGQYDSNGSYAVEGKQTFGGDFRLLPSAGFRLASGGYFGTMEIPIVRGRDFNEGDTYDRPFVAIISEALAKETFGDEDPIGHRMMCGLDALDKWMTIVGVVGDVRQASPASTPGPELYMPLRQHPFAANEVQVVMRTRVPPDGINGTVQQIVREQSPDVAMMFTTLQTSVSDSTAAPRFRATLVSTFAIVALTLALAGIYAVMSYTIAQRTAEFGLRMALGAQSRDVVRLVLTGAGRLAAIGVAIGLMLALATSRVVASMLFGVTENDATTYVVVLLAAMPLVIAVAAIPALRASRVDPLEALRAE